jgi:hypothetical protein
MDLGFGLQAAAGYNNAENARVLREQEQEKFSWDKQRNEADLSLMAGEVENRQKQQKITGAGLDAIQARQPTLEKVKDDQANIAQGQSQFDVKNLPAKLGDAFVKGAIDRQGQADVALGTLGDLISRNDKAGAISFLNEIGKNGNVLPNTNGMTFSDIAQDAGDGTPGTSGYRFTTTDGRSFVIPATSISGAMGKLKTGDYQFLHDSNTGAVVAGNKKTGTANVVVHGDPKASKQNDPADVKTANWIMANKDNPEALKAYDQVRSRKGGESEFIQLMLSKTTMGNETEDQLTQKRDLYGRLYQGMNPAGVRAAAGTTPQLGANGKPTSGPAPSKFGDIIRNKTGIAPAAQPAAASQPSAPQPAAVPAPPVPGLDLAGQQPQAQDPMQPSLDQAQPTAPQAAPQPAQQQQQARDPLAGMTPVQAKEAKITLQKELQKWQGNPNAASRVAEIQNMIRRIETNNY